MKHYYISTPKATCQISTEVLSTGIETIVQTCPYFKFILNWPLNMAIAKLKENYKQSFSIEELIKEDLES